MVPPSLVCRGTSPSTTICASHTSGFGFGCVSRDVSSKSAARLTASAPKDGNMATKSLGWMRVPSFSHSCSSHRISRRCDASNARSGSRRHSGDFTQRTIRGFASECEAPEASPASLKTKSSEKRFDSAFAPSRRRAGAAVSTDASRVGDAIIRDWAPYESAVASLASWRTLPFSVSDEPRSSSEPGCPRGPSSSRGGARRRRTCETPRRERIVGGSRATRPASRARRGAAPRGGPSGLASNGAGRSGLCRALCHLDFSGRFLRGRRKDNRVAAGEAERRLGAHRRNRRGAQ